MTESKTLEMSGVRPSSDQLKRGLPIFFKQLLAVLRLERPVTSVPNTHDNPQEAEVAKSAGAHGTEMLRLGYSLSHVVHAYGSMCQSITELAAEKKFVIDAGGFHELNQCLDVAIAGAVTEYQKLRDSQEMNRETKHLGFLAHELRNALTSATLSFQLVKKGTVGLGGSTGHVLEKSLKRMEGLIDRSLTDVRLRVDPKVHATSGYLLQIVDQILVTAEVEAQSREQKIVVNIDPSLKVQVDQQAFHSALSNLIQNALKFTRQGGKIQVRGALTGKNVVIEVEDECGGLPTRTASDLFKAFEQQHENRKGLGLGLTIARRAITLNHGTLEVRNIPGKGCVFKITLPKKVGLKKAVALKKGLLRAAAMRAAPTSPAAPRKRGSTPRTGA